MRRRSETTGSRPRSGWWKIPWGAGIAAVLVVGGIALGWSVVPMVVLAVFIGLVSTWLILACRTPRIWLHSVAVACALALSTVLGARNPDLAPFVSLGAILLWLGIASGWVVMLFHVVVHAARRSAPRDWSRPVSRPAALVVTGAFCAALLLLHLWPGAVHGALGLPAFALTLGSLLLTWTWLLLEPAMRVRLDPSSPPLSRKQLRLAVSGAALVLATAVLLRFDTLRRAAFALWEEDFTRIARSAPPLEEGELLPEGDGRWIGPWHVDVEAADPRGGVYFRTWRSADLADSWSFGFVWRPNPEGTPFGAAGYWLHPLSGDWCLFGASNDSF